MTKSDCDIQLVSVLGTPSIRLGFHLAPYIARTVLAELKSSTYVLITDSNLSSRHAPPLHAAFNELLPRSARFLSYHVPPGEQSKSREMKAAIEDWLLDHRCTRDTVVLALGGGVVGDLIGFVSATFMRGIRFCQIPTTLLAMVDSSVGGKTAIDTPLGKNLVGAFWQPSFVFIDAAYLETLPEREFVNGMAEMIKTAAIWDEAQFEKLESNVESIRSAVLSPPPRDPENPFPGRQLATRSRPQSLLLEVIADSVGVKAEVVTKDEKETGLRNLVNFGHTIGHAIEAVLTPAILHGECVSIGMVLEAEVARACGCLSSSAIARLSKCLKAHGLPISLSDPRIVSSPNYANLKLDRLLDLMSVDKKNDGKLKKLVLLSRIGKTLEERATGVEDGIIRRIIAPAVRVCPGPPPPNMKEIVLTTPGSKSISNRALVLAALGHGTCRIKNLLHSDDTQVMITALEDMKGASFAWEDAGATLVVSGGGGKLSPPAAEKQVYLGNAGTAARFLTTVCTLIKSDDSISSSTTITGNARMKQRPIGPLVDALRANGAQIDYLATNGCLPLRIGTQKSFPGGKIELAASVSSQYVSSILLAAPYAQEPVTLSLVGGTVISQPYIDMTIAMMASFGIRVDRLIDPASGLPSDVYQIPTGSYTNPSVYEVESDASSATYPLAVAALNGLSMTLETIGSSSLQGDAQFAKKVLEPMGCRVVQTERQTQVVGPSSVAELRQLGEIDMEQMTDAFLTACVLFGVAQQPSAVGQRVSTRIVGIGNQRVKECNRIAAMVKELGKMGIRAEELEDGIEVFGSPIGEVAKRGAEVRIECYDDHRIAMAFSVLGTTPGGMGLVVNEKRCVEKTWPSWWDDLCAKIGIQLEGVSGPESSPNVAHVADVPKKPESLSILLCGMRGSGKSFSGRIAASTLGWPLIDTDLYFQEKFNTPIRAYIQAHGWARFRTEEFIVLQEIFKKFPKKHVISLGGGIVETEEARSLLSEYANVKKGPVVQITRPLEEIIEYLDQDGSRPSLGEPLEEIWERRKPWYRACSNLEHFNLAHLESDDGRKVVGEVEQTKRAMRQFFSFVTGLDTNHVQLDPPVARNTHFLCLTFPVLSPCRAEDADALGRFEEMTTGCDAVELRVDLLSPDGRPPSTPTVPPIEFVTRQVSALRDLTSLPIIYTVRTQSQGGMFPDGREEDWFELAMAGLRTGCEYVDVEFGLSAERTAALCSMKGHSQIIASYHDFSGRLKWDSSAMAEKYERLKAYGDLVKLVSRAANGLGDNLAMLNFREKISPQARQKLITINMGRAGQMSRILSPVLSPTTHPLLPGPPAAPGQLSFHEIQTALTLLGQTAPKKFWLFGSPIGHSRSPLIHQTAFDALGLPGHCYAKYETTTVAEAGVQEKLYADEFGGASVTIPCKVEMAQLVDRLTPDAAAVGAVNTVVPVRRADGTRELLGANTDWEAIRACVAANLPAEQPGGGARPRLVRAAALVLGAGGTARAAVHALHTLGFTRIYICNRTLAKAESLARSFPASYGLRPIGDLEGFGGATNEWLPAAVVSAVPAHATRLESDGPGEGLVVPEGLFGREGGGVVVEMSYPSATAVMRGAKGRMGWTCVGGLDVLVEQGVRQFEIWIGKKAPKQMVWGVVEKSVV